MELKVGGLAEVPGYRAETLIAKVLRVGRKTVTAEYTVPSTGVRRTKTFPIYLVKAYAEPGAAAAAEGFHNVKLACRICGTVRIPLGMKPSAFAKAHMAEVHGR
jgi:hypothetical protein